MIKIYCASTNAGKLREFQDAAAAISNSVMIDVLPGLAAIAPPEETGETFEDNAVVKALYYSQFTPEPVFADDSGLAIAALGGEPGVQSARFAGLHATDAENNALVLRRMTGVEDRAAKFICAIAVAQAGKLRFTCHGEVAGTILSEPAGLGGFGYDPLFYYAPFGKTLAETPVREKFAVSHRGNAFRLMVELLLQSDKL